jgi:serine/threonine-protein kinase
MAYLVMEYLPGITLRDLLNEHKILTTEQTLDILEAVLSGLSAAHKAGIVHRDLKPENVLLADDGRIKIGDFGLARAASANTATGAALLGTIAYLSPELVTRGIADTRSDIYAVGIMMYEMLAGEQPFKGEQPMQIAYQHANGSVPTPSTKNPRVPAELDELVLWATAREPDQRPRDARVMLEQLEETQQQLQTALPTAGVPIQRTVAMPVMQTQVLGSDAETQVITPRTGRTKAQRTGPLLGATEATTLLAEKSGKRRARGWWLFGLVVVLAGLAGGTGWYFGAGPGGTVTIPSSILATDPADATATLIDAGLAVSSKTTTDYSPTVAEGLVLASTPSVDTAVGRGSTVTLTVSQGPKPVTMPQLVGLSDADAQALIAASGLIYEPAPTSYTRFDDTIPLGVVIASFGVESGTGDRLRLREGDTYYDQGAVSLLTSLGPLPTVAGQDYDAAAATLTTAGVTPERGTDEFSDTVESGKVIRVAPKTGETVKPGDTVTVIVSKGPDLVDVPDVVGDTINSAAARLRGAGFEVTIDTDVPNEFNFWDSALVKSITGDSLEDGRAKRDSTIVIHANYVDGDGDSDGDDDNNGRGNG